MTESEQARLGVRSTIDDFASKMQDIRDMTDEMLRRVNAVKQMGARREDTVSLPKVSQPACLFSC